MTRKFPVCVPLKYSDGEDFSHGSALLAKSPK